MISTNGKALFGWVQNKIKRVNQDTYTQQKNLSKNQREINTFSDEKEINKKENLLLSYLHKKRK